jgi:hypothetical protein
MFDMHRDSGLFVPAQVIYRLQKIADSGAIEQMDAEEAAAFAKQQQGGCCSIQ